MTGPGRTAGVVGTVVLQAAAAAGHTVGQFVIAAEVAQVAAAQVRQTAVRAAGRRCRGVPMEQTDVACE